MDIKDKLKAIQKTLNETQAQMATRFGVSPVAFSGWITGKAVPRPKAAAEVDDLYLEVTGQKVIPTEQLQQRKHRLATLSKQFPKAVDSILANPDIRDQFILKLTYNSNSIEGSTLTEPDTAAVLFDNAVLPNKSLVEHLEAKNHQAALLYLLEVVSKGGIITEDLVLRLHGMLMNGIRSDAGFYRNHAVRLVGVPLATANYMKIPSLIPELLAQASTETVDLVALVASFHARFEQIHPFSDGNGRVGRLLMTSMLLQGNFAPAVIRQDKKRLYYTYLYKAQTNGDHSQLEDFICSAVEEGFQILSRDW